MSLEQILNEVKAKDGSVNLYLMVAEANDRINSNLFILNCLIFSFCLFSPTKSNLVGSVMNMVAIFIGLLYCLDWASRVNTNIEIKKKIFS